MKKLVFGIKDREGGIGDVREYDALESFLADFKVPTSCASWVQSSELNYNRENTRTYIRGQGRPWPKQ